MQERVTALETEAESLHWMPAVGAVGAVQTKNIFWVCKGRLRANPL
jgi:hypothetical protein